MVYLDKFESLYFGAHTLSLYVAFFLMVFAAVVYTMDGLLPSIRLDVKLKANKLLLMFLIISVGVLFLSAGAHFYNAYDIDFRHKNRLRDSDSMVVILFLLRFVVFYYLFILFTKIFRSQKITLFNRFMLLMILLSYGLSIIGSLTLVVIALVVVMCFSSNRTLQRIFTKDGNVEISYVRTFLMLFVFTIVSIMVVVVGLANKIGFSAALDMLLNYDAINNVLSIIAARASTSYASVLAITEHGLFDWALQIDVVTSEFETFLYRASTLTGLFEYSLDEVRSVNRINYELLFYKSDLDLAGASPGPLASALYVPLFPAGIFLLPLYFVLIIRIFNIYVPVHSSNITIFGKMVLAFFMLPLLESPLSLVSVITPVFFYLSLYLLTPLVVDLRKIP
jgi:hypothetical protein